MNRKYLFVFTLILIISSYIFSVDRIISNKLSVLNTKIKDIYFTNLVIVNDVISTHFNQISQIAQLKKDVLKNEQYKILYLSQQGNKYDDINLSIPVVNVISYIYFNDFSKVLLDIELEKNKIYGLITKNGYSAGIALKKDDQNIGYLNHNSKSNYAVYIGKNKTPGITHGNKNEEYITIKYIPLWQQINIDDEVVTSGMDNIFSKGVKVGKVVKINKLSTTTEAFVKPYANIYDQDYFYLYKSTKDINNANKD
jgi:rod shape-determining protein MreC